ncbi:MAG: hypothetical protein Satyrvirus11_21 [Satyrvirus sp.]|uniref:Uncharacterized protein n=1 Tax=Satyrvirus sp. TaxID=2487771 RepID=A0A3G5AIU2_9VIRU|nr:MAG: hypothetical protein Satyrvirus11_21 [Satyrvirus sp.]
MTSKEYSNIVHNIKVVITQDNVICYEGIFKNHIDAKLETIKELYRIICYGEIDNSGEYTEEHYKGLILGGLVKNENIDFPNWANQKNYMYYERIMPDMINHFDIMTDHIKKSLLSKDIKVQFFVIK